MQSRTPIEAGAIEILPPVNATRTVAEFIVRDCPGCGMPIRSQRTFGSRFTCENCKPGSEGTSRPVPEMLEEIAPDPLHVLRRGFVPRQDDVAAGTGGSDMLKRIRPYLAVLLLAATCGWLASELIVNRLPAIDRLTTGSVSGIAITSLEARQLNRNGESAVQIKGRITNRGSSRLPVETIAISLLDSEGKASTGWIFHPAIRYLEPGSSFRFSTAKGNTGGNHSAIAATIGGTTRKTGM
ncbi:MAG: hypothetical protein R3D32_05345 [Nitratireductor sp.]